MQVAFYSALLGDTQGAAPHRMHLALGDGEFSSFRVADLQPYERRVRLLLEEFLTGDPEINPPADPTPSQSSIAQSVVGASNCNAGDAPTMTYPCGRDADRAAPRPQGGRHQHPPRTSPGSPNSHRSIGAPRLPRKGPAPGEAAGGHGGRGHHRVRGPRPRAGRPRGPSSPTAACSPCPSRRRETSSSTSRGPLLLRRRPGVRPAVSVRHCRHRRHSTATARPGTPRSGPSTERREKRGFEELVDFITSRREARTPDSTSITTTTTSPRRSTI